MHLCRSADHKFVRAVLVLALQAEGRIQFCGIERWVSWIDLCLWLLAFAGGCLFYFREDFSNGSGQCRFIATPPICMNITFGESQMKWLWSAVTSSPLSSAALITGLT